MILVDVPVAIIHIIGTKASVQVVANPVNVVIKVWIAKARIDAIADALLRQRSIDTHAHEYGICCVRTTYHLSLNRPMPHHSPIRDLTFV